MRSWVFLAEYIYHNILALLHYCPYCEMLSRHYGLSEGIAYRVCATRDVEDDADDGA